ncbi:uncharacterized protein LOC113130101 [Mastacembelus armatus]|uniref:uncharacterized protein LOC113130101 n=1 Tax=Mastacembelus armatus TaxID=205130 RepID=UPI000E460DB5|nr:uncharacterized protein LOC113130101 [Mastacembelus armatus]
MFHSCLLLSLPALRPLPFVLIVGDSHLCSVVDGVVPMPECRMSFGISSTPGACARELQRELAETALPRDPSLVCLLAPSNNLTASRTVDEAAAEFGHLLAYICSRWHKVCVLDFPPRLAGEVEVQTLLSQAYHRVSARMGVHYYSTAEHFPRNCLELWSRDGVHLSDSHGMDILVQLLFEYCCLELETPGPTAPVAPGPSRSTRRASPKVVVTGPLPVPRPPPSEWTVVGQGSKKSQPRVSKPSPMGPNGQLVPQEVETVFSIPLSPVLFSPAMLVEMEKISPSHLGSVDCTSSFPAGKKVCVLDFPPRLAGEVEVQTLLSQAYHRVSARMGVHYYSTAEHFPRNCLELWSRDGVHLSDSHGMDILVQLLFEYCCLELETPAPTAPMAPGPSRSTRRASPKVVVTRPLPVPRPPPSEWTIVGQGSKKSQPRVSKPSPVGPKGQLVPQEVETVFSIPLSPVLFSPAMLVEMEKISPSHLGSVDCTSSFPAGKKVRRRKPAASKRRRPKWQVEAAPVVVEVRPGSPASSTSTMDEDQRMEAGLVWVSPGTSPNSVVILDAFLEDEVQFGDVAVTPGTSPTNLKDQTVVFMDQVR